MGTKGIMLAGLLTAAFLPTLFALGTEPRTDGQTAPDKAATLPDATRTNPTQPSATTLPSATSQAFKPPATRPAAQEFTDFCKELEKAIRAGDDSFMKKHFDIENFSKITFVCYDPNNEHHKAGKKGWEDDINSFATLMKTKNVEYSFLRAFEKDGKILGLFRLKSDNGLNYQECHLFHSGTGEILVSDIYSYSTGELFSKTMRQLWIAMLVRDEKGNAITNIPDSIKEYAENIPQFLSVNKLIQSGKNREALNLIKTLPESVQKQRLFLLYRLLNFAKVM